MQNHEPVGQPLRQVAKTEQTFSEMADGAELMGWSDLMGEIAAGKLADLIAVSEDPLQDVTSLQHGTLCDERGGSYKK